MRKLFVAGNWKMNTLSDSARALAGDIAAKVPAGDSSDIMVLVAPPSIYLSAVKEQLSGSGVLLGAQNAAADPPGALTGEIALEMLQDIGCDQVILGHSERRQILGETDELINRKVKRAVELGVPVILCVGETLDERQSGQMESVLDRQMEVGLRDVTAEQLQQVVIAYEPVWAIGTGQTATPEQADSAHLHLRKQLAARYNESVADRMQILYGGSVKPGNARELLQQPNVDGALVGGASLKSEDFLGIIEAARAIAAG